MGKARSETSAGFGRSRTPKSEESKVQMMIANPFQLNDWEIKNFLKFILAIQLAMWGVIGLDALYFQIPIIRQFIGFIYLTFIPGILILRILKLHKLGNIETLLYSVGLSIATLMFTGLFMNTIYPLFGISGPISRQTVPLYERIVYYVDEEKL